MTPRPDLGWEFDPWIVVPLIISAVLYVRGVFLLWRRAGIGRGVGRWQAVAFVGGWLILASALVSPLHELGEHLFVAHMVEHELLMVAAAPLFTISRPLGAWLQAIPRSWRMVLIRGVGSDATRRDWRWLMRPMTATVLHGATIWLWHIPACLDATLTNENLHRLQHVTFLGTALIFWWALIRLPHRQYGAGAMHVFLTMVHTNILGALITLAPHVMYPGQTTDAPLFGLTPLDDQQLAGLVMWVPGGAIYLAAGLVFATLWLTSARQTRPSYPFSESYWRPSGLGVHASGEERAPNLSPSLASIRLKGDL
ncbi:MAG TPA: cytochrome c oxidase assembly protein [Caulobacteraceae bacterium]|jgi:cytochrome c oxidase assembly factor CtaG|nr:cytochrome c oxidase assembly protein [Caulobacteraceae bacterium]